MSYRPSRTRMGVLGAATALVAAALIAVGVTAPDPVEPTVVPAANSVSLAPSLGSVTCANAQHPLVVPQHIVDNHMVGETHCSLDPATTTLDVQGHLALRLNVRLSGTAAGYADPVTVGNTRKDIVAKGSNGHGPDILFPQFGIAQYVPATATYSGSPGGSDSGAGLDMLLPSSSDWNGKMVVVTHGQGDDSPMTAADADLVPRHIGGGADLQGFTNLFAGQFLDMGYAVAYIRRPAAGGSPGGSPLVPATLTMPDGSVIHTAESLNDYQPLLTDFTQSAKQVLAQAYGKTPSKVLFYGHSAANILASVYQLSGSNVVNGHKLFDGFLLDDLGGGLVMPYAAPEGQVIGVYNNQVVINPAWVLGDDLKTFVPVIMFGHDQYLDTHSWAPGVTYLRLKETVLKLYQTTPLRDKTRLYVIAGVSHQSNQVGSPAHTEDIGGVVVEEMTVLDQWSDGKTVPVPSEANLADVDGRNTLGVPTQLELPQYACPTGYWYPSPFPNGASSTTGFVLFNGFTGQSGNMEAVDANGVLRDYPGAARIGVRDVLPTLNEVWSHLGFLRGGKHTVTAKVYERCIANQVHTLVAAHLLTALAGQQYNKDAALFPNGPLTGVGSGS